MVFKKENSLEFNIQTIAENIAKVASSFGDFIRNFFGIKTKEEKFADLFNSIKQDKVHYEGCPAGRWTCASGFPASDVDPVIEPDRFSQSEIVSSNESIHRWISVDNSSYPAPLFEVVEFMAAISHHATDSGINFDEGDMTLHGEIWDVSKQMKFKPGSEAAKDLVQAWGTVLSFQQAIVKANENGDGNYRIFFEKKYGEGLRWYIVAGLPRALEVGRDVRSYPNTRILSEESAKDLLGINDDNS